MFTQAGIMRKTHYKFVKEGETDVKTEDSEKPEEGKAAKLLYREPAKRMSRKERKLKEKRRKQINKHIDHAMGFIAIALCTVSAILDVKNNKDS